MNPLLLLLQTTQSVSGVDPLEVSELVFDLLLLLIVVVFGGLAILVAVRRFRDSVSRKKPRPTETVDIWSMHTLPPDLDLDESAQGEDPPRDIGEDEDES